MHHFYDWLGGLAIVTIAFLAVYAAGLGLFALFCVARDLFEGRRRDDPLEHLENALQSRSNSVKERK